MEQMNFSDVKKEIGKLKGIRKNVHKLLVDNPKLRDSDVELSWEYWKRFDNAIFYEMGLETIKKVDFIYNVTPSNSIERAARWIRHYFPELKGSEEAEAKRESKRIAVEKIY